MQQTLDSLHANVLRTKLDCAAAVAPRLLYQRAIDGMDQEESGLLPALNTLAQEPGQSRQTGCVRSNLAA